MDKDINEYLTEWLDAHEELASELTINQKLRRFRNLLDYMTVGLEAEERLQGMEKKGFAMLAESIGHD